LVPGGAGGGLGSRGHDQRTRALAQRGRQLGGPDAQLVDRDRHRRVAHGRHQIEGHGMTGILDDDPVRWHEPGGQDALDAVQGAAGDHEAGRVDAVGGELVRG
jgi:hypothetical protein